MTEDFERYLRARRMALYCAAHGRAWCGCLNPSVSLQSTPKVEPVEETRRGVRSHYGVDVCINCDLPVSFCRGH